MDQRRQVAETVVGWAAAEGWNPGLDDAERFLRADPGAFMATELGGEIVAAVSCALYGERYSFIGFFIVAEQLRGAGIGAAIFDRALERANGRVIGLDGVLEQQGYYERRGFERAHLNVRWRIAPAGDEHAGGLVDLGSVPFEQLVDYDTSVFGAGRETFLRRWIAQPRAGALARIVEGRLVGYGVLRRCRVGAKIGPLFADDEETAGLLLDGLIAAAPPGAEVFLDSPEANPSASDLRASRDMEPVFETARMYRGGRPPEAIERVFGVTSFEFG